MEATQFKPGDYVITRYGIALLYKKDNNSFRDWYTNCYLSNTGILHPFHCVIIERLATDEEILHFHKVAAEKGYLIDEDNLTFKEV